MTTCQVHTEKHHQGVAVLTFENGRANALTPDFIAALCDELDRLARDDLPQALVLKSVHQNIFSAGLDLPTVAYWGREQIRGFFGEFLRLIDTVVRFPAPTVAAVHGHAIAGGFLLALAADFRVVSDKKSKFGLSEVDLGVAVPSGMQLLMAERTSPQATLYYGTLARLFTPTVAKQIGFADELVADACSQAMELAGQLACKPGDAAALSKQWLAIPLADRILASDTQNFERFLDSWMSETAQAVLQVMAKKLSH